MVNNLQLFSGTPTILIFLNETDGKKFFQWMDAVDVCDHIFSYAERRGLLTLSSPPSIATDLALESVFERKQIALGEVFPHVASLIHEARKYVDQKCVEGGLNPAGAFFMKVCCCINCGSVRRA